MSLVVNAMFITEVANFTLHLTSMFLELPFQCIQQTAIIFSIQSFHELFCVDFVKEHERFYFSIS